MREVAVRLLFLPLLMVAAAIALNGNGGPGGPVVGGLCGAVAVLLQYVALDRRVAERAMPAQVAVPIGMAGLFLERRPNNHAAAGGG